MGACHDKDQLLEGWGFGPYPISPNSLERVGIDIDFSEISSESINHAYVMMPG